MGLIKKIFGGIFGLIGSIFGSIAKIFGIGKKGEFFMELDDADSPALESQSAPNKAEQAQAKPAQAEKVKAPVKVAEKSGEQPQQAQASFKEQLPAAPEPAKTEKAPAAATKAEMPEISNFATDYLVNPRVNRSPRRRPGPSLSPFKEMAKTVGRKSPSMG